MYSTIDRPTGRIIINNTVQASREEVKDENQHASYFTTSILTGMTPERTFAISPNAAIDKSMIRSSTKGPRSLIVTITALSFSRFVTFTLVPKGNFLCAAVFDNWLNRSPLAVFWD